MAVHTLLDRAPALKAQHEMALFRPGDDKPVWRTARGEHVVDVNGHEFVDLAMGWGACLWGHGTIYERILRGYDATELAQGVGSAHTTLIRETCADALAQFAAAHWSAGEPIDVAILHTGAEVVECALKTALAATGRSRIVAFENCYHGTFGVAAAASFAGDLDDTWKILTRVDDVTHVPFGEVPTLDEQVACVIVEPIQGNTGVILPPETFLHELREECDRVGALLIVDDVLAGSGRTGVALEGVAEASPDIVVLAKAIAGGMMGAAVLCKHSVSEAAWASDDAAGLSTTYYGHPFTCAAVLEVLDLLQTSDLPDMCGKFERALARIGRDSTLDVRGKGAFWSLVTGRKNGGRELARQLLRERFIVSPSGTQNECVNLMPCLTMEQQSLDRFVDTVLELTNAA